MLAPALPRGLVGDAARRRDDPAARASALALRPAVLAAARPQFLAYRVQDLHRGCRRWSRATCCGWPLLTWTVRTPEDRARAARYADQIIFEGFRP